MKLPSFPSLSLFSAPASVRFALGVSVAAFSFFAGSSSAEAASQTWRAIPTDATWAGTGNWGATGTVTPPGLGTGLITNDVATFNTVLSGGIGGSGNPIVLDATRSIGGITFDTANVDAYTIGTNAGSALILSTIATTPGIHVIQLTGLVTSSEIIAAPIKFVQPSSTNGFYGLSNNAASSSATLTLSGTMTAGAAAGRPTNLVLDGINTGSNTISGAITSTTTGQGVSFLTKNGAGRWDLGGNNVFTVTKSGTFAASGNVTVNAGALNLTANNTFTGSDSLSSFNFTVNGGTATLLGSNSFAGLYMTTLNAANGIIVNNSGILVAENNAALGTNATANTNVNNYINNGGTLELNSSGPSGSITLDNGLVLQLNNGGTIRSNGSNATNSRINLSTAAAVSATISTVNAADVFTIGNGSNDLAGGAADTVLHVAGLGTVFQNVASNYAGTWSIDAGTLKLGSATALGAATTTGVAFGSGSTGKLQLNGNSVTVTGLNSNATVGTPIVENGAAGTSTLTVNNTSVTGTYAGVLQDGTAGTLALIKSGAGTLTLSGLNTYTGATTLSGGTLIMNGTGSSAVSVASGATFGGAGTTSGGVTIVSGSILTPGNPAVNSGVGTLTVGSLSLASGSVLNYEFGSGNDQISVTGSGGLSVNGGGFDLYAAGGTTQFAGTGTFNLFSFSGALGGAGIGTLGVLNPVSGHGYLFATSGSTVTLTISASSVGSWIRTGGSTYNSGASWDIASVPNSASASATFGSAITAPSTVTLDTSITLGSIVFSNANAYTVAAGTGGTLTLNNGVSTATITATGGAHAISAPIALNSNLTVTVGANPSDSLAISGNLTNNTGTPTLTKNGVGTLTLAGTNSYGPSAGSIGTILSTGTLAVGSNAALSTGDLSITGNSTLQAAAAGLSLANNIGVATGLTGTIDTNGNSFTLSGVLTGASSSVAKVGAGTLSLTNNSNSFATAAGTALNINAGTLQAGSATAIPTGVLLNLGGGTLDLNANALSVSSLIGTSGTITDNSAGAGTTVLTVNQTATTSYAGALNDGSVKKISLAKTGAGTLNLTGTSTNTANTTIGGGVLAIGPGALYGTAAANVVTGQLGVNGGTLTASASSNVTTASVGILVSSGTANFNGGLTTDAGTSATNLIQVSGGNLNAASLYLGRTGLSLTAQPAAGNTANGLYVNGGAVHLTGALNMGTNSASNSSVNARLDSGSLTVDGTTIVTLNNGGRWSVLDINGGTLTSNDTTGAGVRIGGASGITTAMNAILLVRAGTANTNKITFGDGVQTAGTDVLSVTGGTLYLGSGGLVLGGAGAFAANISMGTATVGALADWSSSMAMTLSGATTFQAANATATPHNISLSGTLTGNTNLNKTGAGSLTLTGTDSLGSLLVKAGAVVMDTGGTVTTGNFSSIGQAAGDTAIATVKGSAIWNANGDLNVGDSGAAGNPATGTLNLQDTAAVNVGAANGFFVGAALTAGAAAVGTVNQSGGILTTNNPAAGTFVIGGRSDSTGTGTYNLNGGTADAKGLAYIGGLGTGTLTLSSSGQFIAEAGLRLGNGPAANGTVNLNGGTIKTTLVNTNGGTSTFNFNGGTLQATAASTAFLTGLTTANIQAGGAIIVDGGFVVTIGQNLIHDSLLGNTTDGGLTKSGIGTLTLTGTNTYSGPTMVTGGILEMGGSITGTASVSVNTGAFILSGGSEAINNSATLSLSPGTELEYKTGLSGRTETFNSLTLLGNAIIDFGDGNTNQFAFTNGISGLGSNTLSIYDWSGPFGNGAQDVLALSNSLNATELGHVRFYSDAGITLLGTGSEIAFSGPAFQIAPIPEPSVIGLLGGVGLLHLIGFRGRRRRSGQNNRRATLPAMM